ncbi:RapZ C-terminal domain-containing protein [Nocardiopsis dassonvillei]|uniref:RapZ C-terminal domain-containing protein n=1 Tax=Nocardiopsis dassonvillei TaxID=2014 RepID=UPI003F5549D7
MTSRVLITSFGFAHLDRDGDSVDSLGAHLVIDLRVHFRDPHVNPALRALTANDAVVRAHVLATPGIRQLVDALVDIVAAYAAGPVTAPVHVAVGCAGGRHRAPSTARELARRLRERGLQVGLVDLHLDREVIAR